MQTLGALRFASDDARALVCPRCGSKELRLSYSVTYDGRDGGMHTYETTVDAIYFNRDRVDSETSNNPSPKNKAMAVGLDCEACGDPCEMDLELLFAQHDGELLVYWREALTKL